MNKIIKGGNRYARGALKKLIGNPTEQISNNVPFGVDNSLKTGPVEEKEKPWWSGGKSKRRKNKKSGKKSRRNNRK